MPVTPFHFGPGALAKAAAPKHFSLIVFGLTQVAIDLESLYFLVQGSWPVHRLLHTFAGAGLVALGGMLLGPALANGFLGRLRPHLSRRM